ncbi:MAG: response regulator [Pseudomonadota bacterium]
MNPLVLIIDTDSLSRQSLASRLKSHGFQAVEAESLFEAEQAIQDREVDVVLLDIRRLKGHALRLLQSIKNARPEAEVILLTGPDQIGLSIQGMKLGAFDDLIAPFDVGLLLARISAAWEKTSRRKSRLKKRLGSKPGSIGKFTSAVGLKGVRMLYGEAMTPPTPSQDRSFARVGATD